MRLVDSSHDVSELHIRQDAVLIALESPAIIPDHSQFDLETFRHATSYDEYEERPVSNRKRPLGLTINTDPKFLGDKRTDDYKTPATVRRPATQVPPVVIAESNAANAGLTTSFLSSGASLFDLSPDELGEVANHEEQQLSPISALTETTPWDDVVAELQVGLFRANVLIEKRLAIEKQLDSLIDTLSDIPSGLPKTGRENAITAVLATFVEKCDHILEDKYLGIMKIILKIAAVALVAVITAAVGFALGLILGAWMGPGAFVAGVIVGSAAAVAVVASSGVIAGLYAYGLFKKGPAEQAVIDTAHGAVTKFADDIKLILLSDHHMG